MESEDKPLPKQNSFRAPLRSVQERRFRDAETTNKDDDIREWLAEKLESPKYLDKSETMQSLLRDGTDLCKVISLYLRNPLRPKIPATNPLKQLDNISQFLSGCAILSIPFTFSVGDLHQNNDFPRVLRTLRALISFANAKDNGNDPSSAFSPKLSRLPSFGAKLRNPVPYQESPQTLAAQDDSFLSPSAGDYEHFSSSPPSGSQIEQNPSLPPSAVDNVNGNCCGNPTLTGVSAKYGRTCSSGNFNVRVVLQNSQEHESNQTPEKEHPQQQEQQQEPNPMTDPDQKTEQKHEQQPGEIPETPSETQSEEKPLQQPTIFDQKTEVKPDQNSQIQSKELPEPHSEEEQVQVADQQLEHNQEHEQMKQVPESEERQKESADQNHEQQSDERPKQEPLRQGLEPELHEEENSDQNPEQQSDEKPEQEPPRQKIESEQHSEENAMKNVEQQTDAKLKQDVQQKSTETDKKSIHKMEQPSEKQSDESLEQKYTQQPTESDEQSNQNHTQSEHKETRLQQKSTPPQQPSPKSRSHTLTTGKEKSPLRRLCTQPNSQLSKSFTVEPVVPCQQTPRSLMMSSLRQPQEQWPNMRTWLADVLEDKELAQLDVPPVLVQRLKSGVLLCRLANIVKLNSVPSIYSGRVPFLQAQNIELFLDACRSFGIPSSLLFEAADLQEERCIPLVIRTLENIAGILAEMPDYHGPKLSAVGVKINTVSEKEKLGFSVNSTAPPQTKEESKLVTWANKWIKPQNDREALHNLSEDIRSGAKLIRLVSALCHTKPSITWYSVPETLVQCRENIACLVQLIEQNTYRKLEACSAQDIAQGHAHAVSKLLCILRDQFDFDFHFKNLIAAATNVTVDELPEVETTEHIFGSEAAFNEEEGARVEAQMTPTICVTSEVSPVSFPPASVSASTVGEASATIPQVLPTQTSIVVKFDDKNGFVASRNVGKGAVPLFFEDAASMPRDEMLYTKSEFVDPQSIPISPAGLKTTHNHDSFLVVSSKQIVPDAKTATPHDDTTARTTSVDTVTTSSSTTANSTTQGDDPIADEVVGNEISVECAMQEGQHGTEEKSIYTCPRQSRLWRPAQLVDAGIAVTSPVGETETASSWKQSGTTFTQMESSTEAETNFSSHRERYDSANAPPTFAEMLGNADLRHEFLRYLEDNGAAENLLFVSEAEAFAKHTMPSEELLLDASRIYAKFLDESSESEVNVSSMVKVAIRNAISSKLVDSKLFDMARREVTQLLQAQLFPLWTQLPIDWHTARTKVSETRTSKHGRKKSSMKSGDKGGLLSLLQFRKHVDKSRDIVRRKIATDLLQTEEIYVAALEACKKHLSKPEEKLLDGGHLSDDQVAGVFTTFSYLHFHQKQFKECLREKLGLWDDSTTLGDVFIEHEKLFKYYEKYCETYADALSRLHTIISLRKPLQETRLRRLCGENNVSGDSDSLDTALEQYVVLPTQRLPQYLFALMNLLKYTAKSHADNMLLSKAITDMRAVVERMMQGIDQLATSHIHKLLSVAASIEGREAELLVVPRRRFIREGMLAGISLTTRARVLSSSTTTTTIKKPYCFLFDDLLVCCTIGSKESEKAYTFVGQLPLPDIMSVHVNSALTIILVLAPPAQTTTLSSRGGSAAEQFFCWTLRAQSEEERFLWENDISAEVNASRTKFRREVSPRSGVMVQGSMGSAAGSSAHGQVSHTVAAPTRADPHAQSPDGQSMTSKASLHARTMSYAPAVSGATLSNSRQASFVSSFVPSSSMTKKKGTRHSHSKSSVCSQVSVNPSSACNGSGVQVVSQVSRKNSVTGIDKNRHRNKHVDTPDEFEMKTTTTKSDCVKVNSPSAVSAPSSMMHALAAEIDEACGFESDSSSHTSRDGVGAVSLQVSEPAAKHTKANSCKISYSSGLKHQASMQPTKDSCTALDDLQAELTSMFQQPNKSQALHVSPRKQKTSSKTRKPAASSMSSMMNDALNDAMSSVDMVDFVM